MLINKVLENLQDFIVHKGAGGSFKIFCAVAADNLSRRLLFNSFIFYYLPFG